MKKHQSVWALVVVAINHSLASRAVANDIELVCGRSTELNENHLSSKMLYK
tara:strand:- start:255 stop:407 length:153 start_codon:yes stop_codon:yes gene_type:complete